MKHRARGEIHLQAFIVSTLYSVTSNVVVLSANPSKHHGTKPQATTAHLVIYRTAALQFHMTSYQLDNFFFSKLYGDHVKC